jgi:hypothetical protein
MTTQPVFTVEDVESQVAFELPDRQEMSLVHVTVSLLNGNTVIVSPEVAANLCGISVLDILSKNITSCHQKAHA